jgi:hypothetical protein
MNTYPFWIGLVLGLVGMAGDFVIPLILGRRYPGYSHLRDTISTLGTEGSPVKRQLSVWLIALGACFLAFAAGQWTQFHPFTWRHWLYITGIVVFGLGAGVVAGIFPEDAPGTPETLSGKIHGLGAGIGFTLLLLAPLWARGMAECSASRGWNTLGFLTGLVAFVLFLVSGKSGWFLAKWTGLWQRVYLAVIYSVLLMNALVIRAFAA